MIRPFHRWMATHLKMGYQGSTPNAMVYHLISNMKKNKGTPIFRPIWAVFKAMMIIGGYTTLYYPLYIADDHNPWTGNPYCPASFWYNDTSGPWFWASQVVVKLVSRLVILYQLYIVISYPYFSPVIYSHFIPILWSFYPRYLFHSSLIVAWLHPHHLIWFSWVHHPSVFFLRPSAHLWM